MIDNFIQTGIENTYLLVTGRNTMKEICEKCDLQNKSPIFFIEPEELTNTDIDEMIEHFCRYEEYEKCAELIKLKK